MADQFIAGAGALLTVLLTLLTIVVTLQKMGIMQGRERNPQLTKTLNHVVSAMTAMEDRMGVVEVKVGLSGADIQILRGQHGEPAAEGEFESWKISPILRDDIHKAARYSVLAAQMLDAVCKSQAAAPDTESRAGANWGLVEASKDYDALKREAS